MDRRHNGALLLAFAFLAGGCVRAPTPEPFPQATADAAAERFAAHDAAGVASFYTADAVLLPPDQMAIAGRAAVEEFFAHTNPADAPSVEVATFEVFVFGDNAWRQGSFRIEGASTATPATGKFVELWKKVDGAWLIHREIWNANTPPPAVPEAESEFTDATDDEPA